MVMAELAVFRLYILGQPDFENDNAQQTLTILAEYRTARKLCRVPMATGEVHALAQRSRDLRAYMIAGDPPFDENALIHRDLKDNSATFGTEIDGVHRPAPSSEGKS